MGENQLLSFLIIQTQICPGCETHRGILLREFYRQMPAKELAVEVVPSAHTECQDCSGKLDICCAVVILSVDLDPVNGEGLLFDSETDLHTCAAIACKDLGMPNNLLFIALPPFNRAPSVCFILIKTPRCKPAGCSAFLTERSSQSC